MMSSPSPDCEQETICTDEIVAVTLQKVVAGATDDDVIAIARSFVVAADDVVTGAAENDIVILRAEDAIVTVAAIKKVIAIEPDDGVVTAKPGDDIARRYCRRQRGHRRRCP